LRMAWRKVPRFKKGSGKYENELLQSCSLKYVSSQSLSAFKSNPPIRQRHKVSKWSRISSDLLGMFCVSMVADASNEVAD
jgi:hypothetical protein